MTHVQDQVLCLDSVLNDRHATSGFTLDHRIVGLDSIYIHAAQFTFDQETQK